MSDNIETLLSQTRARLGRDDIFNAPVGTISDDHIAQLKKRLLGQVEPEKQPELPKGLQRPKPDRRVTFPEFAGAMVQELGAGYFKGLLSPVSSFLDVKAQLNPSDVERLKTIRSYVRRDDVQNLISNDFGQSALEMGATHAADVAEVAGTITSFVPTLRAAQLGLRAGGAAIGAAEGAMASVAAPGAHLATMEKALRSGRTIGQATKLADRVARGTQQSRMTWGKAIEQTYSPAQRRMLEIAAENVTATTMFEAAMELDDGEDRLSRIAFDSGLGFLTEGLTSARAILRSGVREELGRTAYRQLTREVPEGVVERVRAGVATVEEAEAVLSVAKKHPSVASTPSGAPTTIVAQARKVQEATWDHILPPPGGFVVDPQMALDLAVPGTRPGVRYKIKVGDQVIDDHIPTGKTQEEAAKFGAKLVGVRDRINELTAQGQQVRIMEVRAGDTRSLNRFKNFFLGKTSARRLTGEGPLPKIPNSAGPETAAVQGRPSEGAKVQVRTGSGVEQVEVVANPNAPRSLPKVTPLEGKSVEKYSPEELRRRKSLMDQHIAARDAVPSVPRPEPAPDA